MPRPRRPRPPPEEPSTQLVQVTALAVPSEHRRLLCSMLEEKLKRLRSEVNQFEEELKKLHEGEYDEPQVVNEHEVPPLPNPFKRVGEVTARR